MRTSLRFPGGFNETSTATSGHHAAGRRCGLRPSGRARHARRPRGRGEARRRPGLRGHLHPDLHRTRQSERRRSTASAHARHARRARPSDVVRAAVQGVRQPLLRRHADPFFVGADHEPGHHPYRHAVRLRDRARDRGRSDEAQTRSAHHQVRADQPRARRPRPGRGAAAEPLRRQGGDGRRGLGLDD